MLMRYLNTLTGTEIEVRSEVFAPHLKRLDEKPVEEVKIEEKPVKKPTTKKGAKKK